MSPTQPSLPQAPRAATAADDGAHTAIEAATLAMLNELDPEGKQGVVQHVMRTYVLSLDRAVSGFDRACEASDLAEIARLAHKLRSSSASLGALALSEHCRSVEALVKEGHSEAVTAAVQVLRNESARVRAHLTAMLAARGSVT